MDPEAYERRSRPDDVAVAFLARYNTLLGHTLVAPRAHREQVTADFGIEEYLALPRLVYRVSEAVRQELPTERLSIMSLGSSSTDPRPSAKARPNA